MQARSSPRSLQIAIVHHTAGSNGYSQAEAPAIVRGIEIYHVKGNGWNDIGYNFLVDRFGQVYEGRFGGIDRNVIGAHAQGFNTGSVGVSVIGEYSSLAISGKARDALERLLAWRLDIAHLDPATALTYISGGNPRFPAGVPVFLRTVSGHRDTGLTDCPGTGSTGSSTPSPGDVSQIGLPKLYAPTVTGTVPGLVRFRARLSAALPWTIDVLDAAGSFVTSTSGLGSTIDWTWDASFAAPGPYTYAIRGGDDLTPAVGTIGSGELALAISGLAADPATVTPNGDGVADAATISYSLSVPAVVTAIVRDGLGEGVATLPQGWKRAAPQKLRFDPAALPDGIYDVELSAAATGARTATASARVAVTRTLGRVSATRVAFSPNRDGRADRIAFRFELAGPADVRLRILKEGKWVATLVGGPLEPGPQTVEWDGCQAVRPAARRRLRRCRRGDRRGGDRLGHAAVRVGYAPAAAAGDAAVPAADLGERARPPDHSHRRSKSRLRRARGRRGPDPERAAKGLHPRGRLGRGRQREHSGDSPLRPQP